MILSTPFLNWQGLVSGNLTPPFCQNASYQHIHSHAGNVLWRGRARLCDPLSPMEWCRGVIPRPAKRRRRTNGRVLQDTEVLCSGTVRWVAIRLDWFLLYWQNEQCWVGRAVLYFSNLIYYPLHPFRLVPTKESLTDWRAVRLSHYSSCYRLLEGNCWPIDCSGSPKPSIPCIHGTRSHKYAMHIWPTSGEEKLFRTTWGEATGLQEAGLYKSFSRLHRLFSSIQTGTMLVQKEA